MSRWLSSVNNILNQLDGQVENVASNASTVPEVSSAATVDAILNKRGLSNVVEDEDIEAENDDNQVVEEEIEDDVNVESQEVEDEEEEVVFEETIEFDEEEKTLDVQEEKNDDESMNKSVPEDIPVVEKSDVSVEVESTVKNDDEVNKVEKPDQDIVPTENIEKAAPVSSSSKNNEIIAPPTSSKSKAKEVTTIAPSSSSSTKSKTKEVKEIATTKKSNESKEISNNKKEIRKLHHTIIELNKDLEITETEMTALRDELERTGIRIEKDRVRYKEEKTTLQKHHFEELSQLKVQHAEAISNLTNQHNTQIETLMNQIQSLEEGRIKESGGYQQELSSALQREQDFTRKNFLLEEEKMTLQSHISMLESQNKALEGRVEHATQTANTAMDREKEMEEKMDDMLSLHAKLINQRQVREAELERTIADLGAALVVAKKSSEKISHEPKSENNEQALQEELETLKAQYMIESQHCTTLKQEIQDITNERTEEIAQSISKQRQSDRKITDLNTTITKLQSQISDYKAKMKQYKNVEESNSTSSHEQKKLTVQIQSLSDQILRQQMKLDLNSSEVSTLKSRLQVALARADNAEHKLNTQLMEGGISDVEKGYPSSGSNRSIRRRKKGESIRSAFKLQNGDKQVGKAIDVMDKFAMDTGKFLRYNAMARGIFILYLLVLHLWALFILVFHVHSFEKEHGDFGSLHGPGHMFKNVTRRGN